MRFIFFITFFLLFRTSSIGQVDTVRFGTDSAVIINYTSTQTRVKLGTTPIPNKPPVANAGQDFTSTSTSFQLNGSLSSDDNGIKSFGWRKIVGGSATLTDTNKSICTVSNTLPGTYRFELRVVDAASLFRADTVQVIVSQPSNGTSFVVPRNTSYRQRNFSGFEAWNYQNYTNFGGGFKDAYFRFVWLDIEKSKDVYDWTRFDQEALKAFSVGAKFSFGIAMLLDSDDFLSEEFFNGSSSRYPKYLHDSMQRSNVRDFATNGQWVPNWNFSFLLDRWDSLLIKVNSHLNEKGWSDRINYIDIRGYGQWGEWHMVNIVNDVNSLPSGTRPTVSTYKRFIDSHIKAFGNIQLVMLLGTLDADWLPNTRTPPEVTYYALTVRNNKGLLGIRRDQWGATDNYIHDYLENNNRSWGNSGPFKNIIMERWKFAPWVGEPMGPGSDLSDIQRQAAFYHSTSIGNGNYTANLESMNSFRQAESSSGYKISIDSGKYTLNPGGISISLSLSNFGNTPCYEEYQLVYKLKGQSEFTFTSNWSPYLKLPGSYSTGEETWFQNIPSGTYTLTATIKNSYRTMPIYNNSNEVTLTTITK